MVVADTEIHHNESLCSGLRSLPGSPLLWRLTRVRFVRRHAAAISDEHTLKKDAGLVGSYSSHAS